MTNYPAQLDTTQSLPTVVDSQSPVQGSFVNQLRDTILSVENSLGVNPAGLYSSVAGRLGAIENTFNNLQIIRLTKDLGGTILNPLVIGLQGRPLAPNQPNLNDVITWNGIAWMPQRAQGPIGPPGVPGAAGIQGPVGASNPVRVPLVAGVKQVAGVILINIGGCSVDMADYPATYQGLNRSVFFVVDYGAAVGTDTAFIQLWDATHGVVITGATDSTSLVNPPRRFISSALTVGSSNGNIRNDVVNQYQVQMSVSAGSTTNNAVCYDAYLMFKYS